MAGLPPSFLFGIAVFGACLVSMAAYAFAGPRRDSDQEGKGAHFFMGFGDFFLNWFMWAIDPSVRLSIALGLTPDFYNYAGLLLGLLGGVAVGLGHLELAGWMIAACGVADILDGRIARVTGVASDYGDFIDSTFDRFVEAFCYLGFAIYLRPTAYGAFLSGAALAGSLIVSYARARGEVLNVLCTGGLMQRGERLVLTCALCFAEPPLVFFKVLPPYVLSEWVLGFLAVTTTITAIHRTYWIAARLKPGAAPQEPPRA
jgi:CDP-diacylglycerol--glycerol-3-phosphate 3-phosphatidyltransferase